MLLHVFKRWCLGVSPIIEVVGEELTSAAFRETSPPTEIRCCSQNNLQKVPVETGITSMPKSMRKYGKMAEAGICLISATKARRTVSPEW